ncbi:hypothetical protein Droror1_Dr00027692 [Drosera rotundifolia]
MSHNDSRAGDPISYRDRRSDFGFGVSGGREKSAMARRDHVDLGSSSPKRIDSDGLTLFKKIFYVESREVATMTEEEVEEYWVKREITVEVKDVPRPVKSFEDIGFQAGVVPGGWFTVGSGQERDGSLEKEHTEKLGVYLVCFFWPFLGLYEHYHLFFCRLRRVFSS